MTINRHMFIYNLLFAALCILNFNCSNEPYEGDIVSITEPIPPSVKSVETFEVKSDLDIIYGQGLSHESLNSQEATFIDLKLDVYYPGNNSLNRPAYLFIHGGGFVAGNKQAGGILNLADYYASRGWVFISINYRLRNDLGTIPQAWSEYTSQLSPAINSNIANAVYPAQRDAKAAVRWLVSNANTYNINTDYITVGGASAGAISAITVGISDPEDFRDELNTTEDPSLNTTNRSVDYNIKTIIDLWGSKVALDLLEGVYGHQRFDTNDPPIFIAHGTQDPTVDFSNAEDLNTIYTNLNIPIAYYPINKPGHGQWTHTIDGKRLDQLAFEFIVEQQGLIVE